METRLGFVVEEVGKRASLMGAMKAHWRPLIWASYDFLQDTACVLLTNRQDSMFTEALMKIPHRTNPDEWWTISLVALYFIWYKTTSSAESPILIAQLEQLLAQNWNSSYKRDLNRLFCHGSWATSLNGENISHFGQTIYVIVEHL